MRSLVNGPIRLADSPAYLIYITARLLRRDFVGMAQQAGYDLYPEQWFILNKLRENPGQSQVELGHDQVADKPTMTRALASLEKRGLLKRKVDREDRRRHQVFLSAKGEKLHDGFAEVVRRARGSLFAGLSDKDIEAFQRVVSVLTERLLAGED